MGACLAAAVSVYAAHGYSARSSRHSFLAPCEYCGRLPDTGQKCAQCVSCGAPLKRGDVWFPDSLTERYITPVKKETREKSTPFHTEEPKRPDYSSPPTDFSMDMTHPANPIGIFSPIWHQHE